MNKKGHHDHNHDDNNQTRHHGSHSANLETPALSDPVCGMQVTRDSEHIHTHEGTEYRFCTGGKSK